MILVQENFRYASGQAAIQQPVSVVVRGTDTLVSLFADILGNEPRANPLITDTTGSVSFYVDFGSYDYLANGGRVPFDVVAGGSGEALAAIAAHQAHPEPHPAYDVDMIDLATLVRNGLV